jgi:hypothetical protein
MIRRVSLFAAAVATFAFTGQAAEAGETHHIDKRLAAVSLGVGAAATAGYFALDDWHWKWQNVNGLTRLAAWGATTIACAAVSPMVATVVLKRPLTQREAGILLGSCIVPIVGGWLVNEAYEAHPEWDPAYKPPHAKKKRAKM